MALVKCPDCGTDVSDAAPACVRCGRPIAAPPLIGTKTAPGPAAKAKRSNAVPGWLVILTFIGLGWYIYDQAGSGDSGSSTASAETSAQPDAGSNPNPAPEILKATPEQLYAAYNQNEVAADDQFKGKIIQVTAPVKSIDKNFTDAVVLKFDTGSEFNEMGAELDASQNAAAAALQRGQVVTVQCAKIMRVMDSPMASDCSLAQ